MLSFLLGACSLYFRFGAHSDLTQFICYHSTSFECAVLLVKYFQRGVVFAQSVQLYHRIRVGCLKLKLQRMFCLVHKFNAKHGPTCLFHFVLCKVSLHGCLGIEGLNLILAGYRFCSLCGKLLGCGVYMVRVQCRVQETDILF